MSWKETVGISESTTKVQVSCPEDAKQEWENEVQDHGYKSLSAYLLELIQEARAYRADGFLRPSAERAPNQGTRTGSRTAKTAVGEERAAGQRPRLFASSIEMPD